MEIELDSNPGNSLIQRNAELEMISWLETNLNCKLKPKRLMISDDVRLELDGFSENPRIICEAWAHQGAPKSAQKYKVMNDAMKMVLARSILGNQFRAILLFADDLAAKHFRGNTWQAAALQANQIEIFVAALPEALKTEIKTAQHLQ